MLHDAATMLSDAQAITVSAPSTNVHDAGPGRDLGRGREVRLVVRCTEAATAGGAATLTAKLQGSSSIGFGSPVDLAVAPARSLSALASGALVAVLEAPPGAARFLRAYYEVATGPLTAGRFTADLKPRMGDDSALFHPKARIPRA